MFTRKAFCHLREKPAAAMLDRPPRFAISPASRIAAVAAWAIGLSISRAITLTKPLATSVMRKRTLINEGRVLGQNFDEVTHFEPATSVDRRPWSCPFC